jgi:hypothetical protein
MILLAHVGEEASALGVLGTNTGADRCSAPSSFGSALLSFIVGVVIVLVPSAMESTVVGRKLTAKPSGPLRAVHQLYSHVGDMELTGGW